MGEIRTVQEKFGDSSRFYIYLKLQQLIGCGG
jgi:hypothetical protein